MAVFPELPMSRFVLNASLPREVPGLAEDRRERLHAGSDRAWARRRTKGRDQPGFGTHAGRRLPLIRMVFVHMVAYSVRVFCVYTS